MSKIGFRVYVLENYGRAEFIAKTPEEILNWANELDRSSVFKDAWVTRFDENGKLEDCAEWKDFIDWMS